MLFIHSGTDIAKAFGVELISSPEMSSALTNWDRISTGKPPWLNAEDEIGTINMAKTHQRHARKAGDAGHRYCYFRLAPCRVFAGTGRRPAQALA